MTRHSWQIGQVHQEANINREEKQVLVIYLRRHKIANTMEIKETRIELTPLEFDLFKRYLAGEIFLPGTNMEENETFARVIEKADKLMQALDAYDEVGEDLMQWFWDKYQEQQNVSE